MKKTIVILAKSIKNEHFCIAGKDLSTGQWIRPVSDENGGEITREQSRLTFSGAASSYDCKVLHNAEIDFSEQVPLYYQPENYLISKVHWLQRYSYKPDNLGDLLDFPEDLWGNTSNKINRNNISNGVSSSLYLVEVSSLRLYKNKYGKRKVDFFYNNVFYSNFSCTDPNFDNLILQREKYDTAKLCLSLGKLFVSDNCHYKIVATIFI